MIRRWIEVSFQREGVHKYPAALVEPELADVSFLGHPHRHIFHFYVKVEVFHDDREIEFILFKRELESLYKNDIMDLDYNSCEMIAESLLNYIRENYRGRNIEVRVYEDDENGAIVEFTK